MQQKIIVFRDYGNVEVSLFQAEDSVNIPKTILDAAKEAEKDGNCFTLSNVPENYLKKYGLEKLQIETIEMQDHTFGKTPAEQSGIYRPTCRDCNSFEEGSCCRYGGLCNPDAEKDYCLHAEDIFLLNYRADNTCMNILVRLDGTRMWELELPAAKESVAYGPAIQGILDQILTGEEWEWEAKQIQDIANYNPEKWALIPTIC